MAFMEIGIELRYEGTGVNECGIVSKNAGIFDLPPGKIVVMVDPNYFRPTEVDLLVGDSSKAKRKLGWTPKCTLENLVKEMVQNDIEIEQRAYKINN
jgi:GDPmannose 4,6-dehydratase